LNVLRKRVMIRLILILILVLLILRTLARTSPEKKASPWEKPFHYDKNMFNKKESFKDLGEYIDYEEEKKEKKEIKGK